MDDRRISYSSGNFSSIERSDAGNPDSVSDGTPAHAKGERTDGGPAPGDAGNTGPARDAGVEDAEPKAAAGPIGRAGRRHARIRNVANLGDALAATGASREERKQGYSDAPEPFEAGRTAAAAGPQHPETGPAGETSPDTAQGDRTAAGVAAALGAVAPTGADGGQTPAYRERGDAGTGRAAVRPENAPPPEVAELDGMSGKQLDLAEFVIQAAVSGDDDGAVRIPWTPEPSGRGGDGAPNRGGRPAVPGSPAGPASRPGKPLQPGPETAGYGGGSPDSGESAGRRLAARRVMHPNAAPAPEPVPSGDPPVDYRTVGPDLSIPIVDGDDILPVRTLYEEQLRLREAVPARPGVAGRSGDAADARATPVAPYDTNSGVPGPAERPGADPAQSTPARARRLAPGGGAPAGRAFARASERAPAARPGASETARTKHEEPAGAGAGRGRQPRKPGPAAASGERPVLGSKPLAVRTDSFDAGRRTDILCGLTIAAVLGAVAWYFAGPGSAPTETVVDASKTDIAAPKDSGKAGAKTSGRTAAGPPRKAPIYRPPAKIELAAASALGNLEYRITPKTVDRVIRSARGDTFSAMLLRAGVGAEDAARAVVALRKVYDPRSLPIGLELRVNFEAPGIGKQQFLGYRFDSSTDRMVQVSLQGSGNFAARQVEKIVTRVHSRADGQIETSLFGAGIKAGVPPQVMLQMVRLFSFAVDFQRDLHGGEKFHIMYRSQMDEAGRIVRHGDIVYVSLTVGGKTQKLYLYERPKGGASQYLNERGQGNRRVLMKTPIDGARLTSRFGYRKHPLLGFTKRHNGVDFGARPGTPIFAAGSGTIVKIGWFGAFGRYVRIRHGSVYETAYAHMSRFQRGLRVGSRVKQGETIGYVGRSGRTTGPHLHYEVLRNGRHVNPMKVALPSRKSLKGRELKQFLAHRREVDARFAALGLAKERLAGGKVQTVGSKGAAGCKNGAKTDPQTGKPCN